MTSTSIKQLLHDHRACFATGRTKAFPFRLERLKVLRRAVTDYEDAIFHALKQDLNKPAFEAYGGDTAMVINEIDLARTTCIPGRCLPALSSLQGPPEIPAAAVLTLCLPCDQA